MRHKGRGRSLALRRLLTCLGAYQRSLRSPVKLRSLFWDLRISRQDLQRIGSLNPRDWKNSCSPAVNVKLCPQSLQVSCLSWATCVTPLLMFVLRFCY